jgi:hypothetical protein
LRWFSILEINRFKWIFKNWYSYFFNLSRKFIKEALSSFRLDNLELIEI